MAGYYADHFPIVHAGLGRNQLPQRKRLPAGCIIPSMPMAAPNAIHTACSLGRVPLRVLLKMAPAAEPATAPRKPMALGQAPVKKLRNSACHEGAHSLSMSLLHALIHASPLQLRR